MGKTVTTYLIDGDPKGTQYAFISNKILSDVCDSAFEPGLSERAGETAQAGVLYPDWRR